MANRISVVVSQAQGRNPVKRKLEEDIVAGLLFEAGIDVTVVPNLYDVKPDSTSLLALQGLNGHIVVCAWLFERAARWVLDRNGIHGQVGVVALKLVDEDQDDDDEEITEDEKARVVDSREVPNRKIYCLDLKAATDAQQFIDEVKRIHAENAVKLVGLADVVNSSPALAEPRKVNGSDESQATEAATATRIEDSAAGRRWYPVIDYSRCTNCMECIDFCLFGVYGVDRIDTILVEEPDNCRKGCPACSRVCPENAIMFPQHKTPAIAGSMDATASLKIDLSQLFGAPQDGKSAEELAAIERDEQLLLAGREAVGAPRVSRNRDQQPPDELDDLVNELNDLDL